MTSHSRHPLGVVLSLALALSGLPAEPAPRAAGGDLGPLARREAGGGIRLMLEPPVVRIGLSGNGRTVTLQSPGGLHIVDRDTGADAWRRRLDGPVHVVLERDGVDAPPEVFRVQVASVSSREQARDLQARLETSTGEAVEISRNPDRNAWRVRVGQRSSRDEITQVEEKLRDLGYNDLWIVTEAGPGGPAPRMRIVDDDYNDMLTASKSLWVLPASGGRPIKVEDTLYRGVIEVRITRSRRLKVINHINIEDYLRGVVPRELGPTVFPELEALKAQAVAARTYIVANRDQFSEDGYDICDTPRCQVYGGLSAEHPLSDFAVEQTRLTIATYRGEPINAMYTSTCGGHTEDLRNVFTEMEGPYLRGVTCYPEQQFLGSARRTLQGAWNGEPVTVADGERIDVPLAVLEVLGVVTAREADASHLSGAPAAKTVGRWMGLTLRAIGKKPPRSFEPDRGVSTIAELAAYVVDALDWRDRLDLLMDPRDLPGFLGLGVLEATPEPYRAALAYTVKEEILPRPAGSGGSSANPGAALGPSTPVTGGLLVSVLHRIVMRYDALPLTASKYRGMLEGDLLLGSEGELTALPLASRVHIVVRGDSGEVPVSEHYIQEGDNLEYHLSPAGEIDYIRLKANRRSASDDRYSGVYLWEERIGREELEARIRPRLSLGRLVDLIPGRRGRSGRLLDLTVVGTRRRQKFEGFNIERVLGLRETLFLVDRQYGDDGRVETFIFSGKGWGHGVGLCQVGAYGMALRGKSYEEILRHYYTGIDLSQLEVP